MADQLTTVIADHLCASCHEPCDCPHEACDCFGCSDCHHVDPQPGPMFEGE